MEVKNPKLKLMYLKKILLEKTDDEHPLLREEIISALNEYGISMERKSFYRDMEILQEDNVDIIKTSDYKYFVGERDFQLAELKLLVDIIQASRFITAKKSGELIRKIESLASVYQAKQLHRQVYMLDRVKNENENIYLTVDKIHTAINKNVKIKYKYYSWNGKKKEYRRGGDFYEVSPFALLCNNEFYYLVAYLDGEKRHFRVDKMENVEITQIPRDEKEKFEKLDMANYANSVFGMFGGETKRVKLLCKNTSAGIIMDRFGKETSFIPYDEEHFTVNLEVVLSRQFYGWLFSVSDVIKMIGPEDALDSLGKEINEINKLYSK